HFTIAAVKSPTATGPVEVFCRMLIIPLRNIQVFSPVTTGHPALVPWVAVVFHPSEGHLCFGRKTAFHHYQIAPQFNNLGNMLHKHRALFLTGSAGCACPNLFFTDLI